MGWRSLPLDSGGGWLCPWQPSALGIVAEDNLIRGHVDSHGGIHIDNFKLHKVIYSVPKFPRHSESFNNIDTNLSSVCVYKVQVILIKLLQLCC